MPSDFEKMIGSILTWIAIVALVGIIGGLTYVTVWLAMTYGGP